MVRSLDLNASLAVFDSWRYEWRSNEEDPSIALLLCAATLLSGAAFAQVTSNSGRVAAKDTEALAKFYKAAFGMEETNRINVPGGPDVGYIDQFDTAEEFALMARAGMSFQQILASLTTAPADRFGYAQRSGRIAAGMDADLVVLDADVSRDASAFARVRFTIRAGKVIYEGKR